jgi:hypothetical protein
LPRFGSASASCFCAADTSHAAAFLIAGHFEEGHKGVSVMGLSSRDESASQKQISDIVHQTYEAEKRKDLNLVLSHLSEDFAEVARDGNVYHRSDIEAGWSDVKLNDYKLSDCLFRLMTRDAAHLSCIVDWMQHTRVSHFLTVSA